MDQIELFVNHFTAWMDESGAEGNPDLELIRDLLRIRREVQEVFQLRDDMGDGFPGMMVWPNTSLFRTVVEAAPFSFPVDAPTRDALIRTLPLLCEFILMKLTKENPSTLRQETKDLLDVLTSDVGTRMENPTRWALRMRRFWLQTEARFEPPAGADGEDWLTRFDRQPWERRDELIGPMWRAPFDLPRGLWGDATVPRPTVTLPSTLVGAARTAPLMAAVVEVAEFLADRVGAWSGARLADDVVQQVVAATTVADPEAVQEAWRLAVLAGFLWPVPLRVFRGEHLDLWADDEEVLELWGKVAESAVVDLPDPLRDQVVRLILATYHPGLDETSAEVTAVLASPEGRAAVDRLQRLGVLDGFSLTPLGLRGVVFPWAGWQPDGSFVLEAGPWRPDLSRADLEAWLLANLHDLITGGSDAQWIQTADPRMFAAQLVDTMLATTDRRLRAQAFATLILLGEAATPEVDRLAGTALHQYRSFWTAGDTVRQPTKAELVLWAEDQVAHHEVTLKSMERLTPGRVTDLSRSLVPSATDGYVDQEGRLTAEGVEYLRAQTAQNYADIRGLLEELRSDLP
ncbi:MAG TPA: hypothetical protein VGL05_12375 [Kribbella sp.]